MSERFNRNDANVPDDRLFPADFQVDQDGQDQDLLQIAKDFGCLPCIGSGLGVTSLSQEYHKVQIAAGAGPHWAYDKDGKRITVESAQEAVLEDTNGNPNYIVIAHQYITDTPRNAHRTGVEYQTRKYDSFTITVTTDTPGTDEIILATATQIGTGPITVDFTERLATTCRLTAQSMVPGVSEEEAAGEGPPPGQQNELPDYPKGRTIPMPIILSGTRNEAVWNGVETILPEELGRTPAAQNSIILERVNLKSGTPVADVKIWIGDWGTGQQSGTLGEENKCIFTMPTQSGCTAWDTDLWITDLEHGKHVTGPGYYYLVKSDESWFSKITASGADYVECEGDLPDADSHTFYICPYAELYRVQTVPYKTDAELHIAGVHTTREYNRFASPTAPIVTAKELNLGGKYKLKVASIITGDNYTKWAETDFVVGQDLIDCWVPTSENLTVEPVDGGVQVTVPDISEGIEPDAYEACYNFGTGETIADPSFDDSTHPTLRFSERVFKLDIPPGYKVKVKVRAIFKRLVMLCGGAPKVITHSKDYVLSGGVSLRRNRKQYTGLIDEAGIASMGTEVADEVPLANPIWPEKISLFNPTGSAITDIEVYVHGSNQTYTAGRKIEISATGDETEIGSKKRVEKAISDYRITDVGMIITVKNIKGSSQDVTLRYGVQYREDSESEIG